jgi:hypothetical protein
MLQGCLNISGGYWWCDRHATSFTTLWRYYSRPLAHFYLVGRQREENGRASYTAGSQRLLQKGAPPTFSPGVLRWPDRPWRECRALLVGPRVQISLCCIDSRKDRLFLHRRGCTGDEASLYSDRRQSNFAGQARHYGPLVGAHGRGSPEGKRPTVRRAE